MANSEEKVSKFVQAITAYAEEQRDKILGEVESFKAERLQKAEQEVLTDAYQLIQKETADIRGEGIREMSRRDLAARKQILNRRREIMDDVFRRAADKLREYTANADYPSAMKHALSQMVTALPADGTVYYLKAADASLLEELRGICPPGSRLELADDIRIGGIRAVNAEHGQLIDDTLDAKLEAQREWFTTESGLTMI